MAGWVGRHFKAQMRMSIMARMNASDVMGGEDRSGRCVGLHCVA